MRASIGLAALAVLSAPVAASGLDCNKACDQRADAPDPAERAEKRVERRERDRERARERETPGRAKLDCRRDPLTQACSIGASPFAGF
ncbi:hypothetical protein [Sphingomicrobium astaxanthinifaciens]|uniref:hypothetical protein n=1 Tax=Sphingomicrobium astaxanthinifaciens TaxID=1227949 RepID=UPI001FCCB2CF|nr:hypothetical protein [Sphingomicrobium astaxanthinifaciens]MCJ7421905.1 hypothetical protein [Sphingomicrobium astaxanthinifaciens]